MYFDLLIYLIAILMNISQSSDFLTAQKRYEHVRAAFRDKGDPVREMLKKEAIEEGELNILFMAFKNEAQLDMYVRKNSKGAYHFLKSFPVCNLSGKPGPKRKQGDNQVPEGFYYIDRFNPASKYYLSLGINYPNKADRIKSRGLNPGGDIFIHGACVTIGCLPMTDDGIKEIYLYAVLARQAGQVKIPVYIFPFRMNTANMEYYGTKFRNDPGLVAFWKTLKTGYDYFMERKLELTVNADPSGNYLY